MRYPVPAGLFAALMLATGTATAGHTATSARPAFDFEDALATTRTFRGFDLLTRNYGVIQEMIDTMIRECLRPEHHGLEARLGVTLDADNVIRTVHTDLEPGVQPCLEEFLERRPYLVLDGPRLPRLAVTYHIEFRQWSSPGNRP